MTYISVSYNQLFFNHQTWLHRAIYLISVILLVLILFIHSVAVYRSLRPSNNTIINNSTMSNNNNNNNNKQKRIHSPSNKSNNPSKSNTTQPHASNASNASNQKSMETHAYGNNSNSIPIAVHASFHSSSPPSIHHISSLHSNYSNFSFSHGNNSNNNSNNKNEHKNDNNNEMNDHTTKDNENQDKDESKSNTKQTQTHTGSHHHMHYDNEIPIPNHIDHRRESHSSPIACPAVPIDAPIADFDSDIEIDIFPMSSAHQTENINDANDTPSNNSKPTLDRIASTSQNSQLSMNTINKIGLTNATSHNSIQSSTASPVAFPNQKPMLFAHPSINTIAHFKNFDKNVNTNNPSRRSSLSQAHQHHRTLSNKQNSNTMVGHGYVHAGIAIGASKHGNNSNSGRHSNNSMMHMSPRHSLHGHGGLPAMSRIVEIKDGTYRLIIATHVTTFLCIIFYLIGAILWCLLWFEIFINYQNFGKYNYFCQIFSSVTTLLWHLSKVCIYFILWSRVQTAFSSSTFGWSKKILLSVLGLIILDILIVAIGDFMFIKGKWIYDKQTNSYFCDPLIPSWGFWFTGIVDILICGICLYLFVKPLTKLVKSVQIKDERTTFLMIKYTLLTAIAIVSTAILPFLIIGLGLGSIALLDGVINALCMILMSNIHQKLYKKLCCCHILIDGLRIGASKVKESIENSFHGSRRSSRAGSVQGSRQGSQQAETAI